MTKLVGILNITPDSFSDGGIYDKSPQERVHQLIEEGASVIDIGAESTRPNARILSAEEEQERLLPILKFIKNTRYNHSPLEGESEIVNTSVQQAPVRGSEAILLRKTDPAPKNFKQTIPLRQGFGGHGLFNFSTRPQGAGDDHNNILFSLDTRNPETASLAIQQNIDWINDVSGFENPKMIETVAKSNCTAVFMHSLSVPADQNIVFPPDTDVVSEIYKWAENKIHQLKKAGIKNMIFDCGIGFGKTAEQSLELIRNIKEFKKLGVPILVGHSRKSFLKLFTDNPPEERDEQTVMVTKWLTEQGVDYLRVHNVKKNLFS